MASNGLVDPDEWDGVYYDAAAGDTFAEFEFDIENDEVRMLDTFDGDELHTFTLEDFEVESDDFHPISDRVVNDPAGTVESVLRAIATASSSEYDSIEIDYARRAVTIEAYE